VCVVHNSIYILVQHTAARCSTLQHTHAGTAVRVVRNNTYILVQHTTIHYTTLQCTATQHTTLQRSATHCNTQQHTLTGIAVCVVRNFFEFHILVQRHIATLDLQNLPPMGWLRLVGSLKSIVSFAEYRLFYRALLQKRPIIWRGLLIVATPYVCTCIHVHMWACVYVRVYACVHA